MIEIIKKNVSKWIYFAIGIGMIGAAIYVATQPIAKVTPAELKRQTKTTTKTRKAKPWRTIAAPAITKAHLPDPAKARKLVPPQGDMEESEEASAEEADEAVAKLSEEEVCAGDWYHITETALDLVEHQIERGSFTLTQDCLHSMRQSTKIDTINWFVDSCVPAEFVKDDDRDLCVSRAQIFRSYIVGKQYSGPEVLSEFNTPVLANLLTMNFLDRNNLTSALLDQNIDLADEIIYRDPDAYGAYKAKLVSMILKETKFDGEIDEDDFESTLAELTTFESFDRTFSLRQESVRLEIEEQIYELEEQLAELEPIREPNELEEAIDAEDLVEAQEAGTAEESGVLQKTEFEILDEIADLDRYLDEGVFMEEEEQDPDVVKIPFIRYLVRGDNEGLVEAAETYLEDYPESPIGNFYLAQGLWRTGDKAEALNTLRQSVSDEYNNEMLLQLLQSSGDKKPLEYLNDLEVFIEQ